MKNAEELAKTFHEVYEKLAPAYGYETNKETRIFDKNSRNGKLMIATCEGILNMLDSELISEIEKKMEKEAQQKSKQNRVFHQGRYDLLTEIINLIKEK